MTAVLPAHNALPDVATLLTRIAEAGLILPSNPIRVGAYGNSAELSQALLALIREGRKRAGTSLLWALEAEGETVPEVGDIELVVDHRNALALVTQATRIEVLPFNEVGSAYAEVEGEGDGSLEYWRSVHWSFFSDECKRLGREPSESMPVVCRQFEVLYVLP